MNANAMQRRRLCRALALGALALGATGCNKLKLSPPPQTLACGASDRQRAEVAILLDRTTLLEPTLRTAMAEYLLSQRGQLAERVVLASFGGRAPTLLRKEFDLALRPEPPNARWSASPQERQDLQRCFENARGEMASLLRRALDDGDDSIHGQSPIFEALAALGTEQGSLGAPGSNQDIQLVSDGIEHSSLMSFYLDRSGTLALPDPDQLVRTLKAHQLIPDFSGRKVSHLALGMQAPDAHKPALRSVREVEALRAVWNAYWAATGASEWHLFEPLPLFRD